MAGLTPRNLLRATPIAVKRRFRDILIQKYVTRYTKDGRLALMVKTKTISNKNIHKLSIISIEPIEKLRHLAYVKCKFACDCGFWVFYGSEWVLNKSGAANIIGGNGLPPDIRNPHRKKYVCKHVGAVIDALVSGKMK